MAKKKGKGKWKWPVAILLVVGIGGAGYVFLNNSRRPVIPIDTEAVRTADVIRGSISSIVSGSGSVATSREQTLAAPGASTLLQINVEDGDQVARGDVLFVLDCPEVVSSQQAVSKYEYQLDEYYAARDELQRVAEIEYLVTSVNARVGDKLAKNGNLMSLLDISTMTLQVPAGDGADWASGQRLQISLLEYGNTVYGTLSGSPTASSSNGMDYLTFTLLLDKGQRIGNETFGQAYNQSLNSQAAVMLKPNAETLIKSPADGYLEVLNAAEGEIMAEGTLMYRIGSTNLDSQISDANSEMQVAMANLKQKQTTLTADFDGIYYAAADSSGPKNTFLQMGDSLKTGEGLGKVVDSDRMQIVFNVDELDIAKVEIGQEVNVVADAMPDRVYTGRVARIAQEGASSGNVAYYWVLIEVTEWEGLKVGMTSSLEIVVEESFGTLLVPINAVHTMRGLKYVILAEDQSGGGGAAAILGGQGGRPGQGNLPGQNEQPQQGNPVQGGDDRPVITQRQEGQGAESERNPSNSIGDAPAIVQERGSQPKESGQEQPAQGTQPGQGNLPGQNEQPPQGNAIQGGAGPQQGRSAQPGQDAQAVQVSPWQVEAGSDATAFSLPERAVIVETGIVNDTFVEILSGLEEGQIVEVAGTRASGNMNQTFMVMGPGAGGGLGGNATMTVTRAG